MKKIIFLFSAFILSCCSDKVEKEVSDSNSFDTKKSSYKEDELENSKKDEDGDLLLKRAAELYDQGNYAAFKKICLRARDKAIIENDSINNARAHRYLAEYYLSENYSDSAFQNFKIAEKIYRRLGDGVNLGKVLYKKAVTQYDGYDVLGAELSITEAYSYIKESGDDELLYATLSMTGIISNALEEYDNAIRYHLRALDVVKKGKLDPSLFQKESTLNNLGGVYQRIDEDEKAISKFEEALSQPNIQKRNPELYSLLLDNLGYSKLKIGQLNNVERHFKTAIRIRDSLNANSAVIVSKLHLSEYYQKVRKTELAINTGREALDIAKLTNAPVDLLITLKHLAAVDKEQASKYTEDYIKINDELQKVERRSRDKFAKLELETDQIETEKNKLEQQNRNLLYFFFGTLTVGFLLFIIRSQRARNRELLLKQAQQKANEEIYNLMIKQQSSIEESRVLEKKRIAQELHDGVLGRLFGTRLNLDSMNKLSDDDSIKKRQHYLSELKNIEQDIREISHDLSREKFALINNFLAILQNLIEEQENAFKSKVSLELDDKIKWDTIANGTKINIYRIIQECLQNINKYANATIINIKILLIDEVLIVEIKDNGIGFNVETKRKGIGLQNMLSRAEEMNANIEFLSEKNKGTTIKLSIGIKNII